MAAESEETHRSKLEIVSKRNRFMEGLRRGKELYRKRRPFHTVLVKGLEWMLIAKTKLTGKENLDLVVEKIGRERITGAANHTSDTDHGSFERTLVENGYGVVADRLVFPAGLKMWDRPETEWAMWGMNTVPVPAPEYFNEAARLSQLSLSEGELRMLLEYQENLRWLAIASLRALIPDWSSGNIMPMIYPETTRSRNGWINRGREEIDVYLRKGWILPLMIEGPGAVFPPDSNPNLGKIIRREFEVNVAAGELISGEQLHGPATLGWLRERGANPVDFVMSRIVILNPEQANPELRSLYGSLTKDIPEGLILRST